MSPQSILIGQIILVFTTVICGVWFATQWVAHQLAYDPYLGAPWFSIVGQRFYYPWRLFEWWFAFGPYASSTFTKGGIIAASSGIFATFLAIIASVWRGRVARYLTTYGSSRWAKASDISKAGMTKPKGVFLGRFENDYLRHDGPEHVLTFAPTRSGKGVGLVIPTLLSWTGSAVIHDIKGENWQLTAGWRSTFSHTLLFDPTNAASAKYNPLLEVRKGANEVRDVQNIADILVDPEGALERRTHWEKTGHALLVGAILHVLYAEEEKTLARVASFLSDPSKTFARTLWELMSTNHLGTEGGAPKTHPVVAQAARELFNKSENERSGVLSTAMSFLGLYRDPTVAEVTSKCDWRIADLVDAEKPVSLYLVVPPSDISRTKPLVRLILNQIGRRLTESLETEKDEKTRHKVLLMLDEFPALGRLDFFESALAFMAGYGLRAFLIAQSLNQIEKAYGPNNSILDNCHVRVAFASNDERTAKRISDALGTKTEMRAMRNYAGHRLAPWLSHVMVSRQETARQLLTPGEVMQLPGDDEVVLVSGQPPIRAKKLRYFEDVNFIDRVIDPPALAGPDAPYPTYPVSRRDDWGDQTRSVDNRLVPIADSESVGPDDGGKDMKPEIDGPATEQKASADLGQDQGPEEQDGDLEARRTADLAAAKDTSRTVRRAYGLDKGAPQIDLVDF